MVLVGKLLPLGRPLPPNANGAAAVSALPWLVKICSNKPAAAAGLAAELAPEPLAPVVLVAFSKFIKSI